MLLATVTAIPVFRPRSVTRRLARSLRRCSSTLLTASTSRLHDEDRRAIYAEASELEAANAFLDSLSDATLRLLFPKIETRLALASANARPHTAEADHAEDTAATIDAALPHDLDPAAKPMPDEATTSPAVMTIAIDLDVPLTESKKRAGEAFERTYVTLALAATKGNVSRAAKRAGVDRSNFKRILELHALRKRGTSMAVPSKKIEDAAKHTDTILKLLEQNPQGLRTHEIAKAIDQPNGNTHNLLKHLQLRRKTIERHGEPYAPLWTLRGGTPIPRIETIPAAAVAILSKAVGPMDSRRLRHEMSALLAKAGKPASAQGLRRGIARLISNGVLTSAGANEHGPLVILPKIPPELEPEDSSELN